MNAVPRFPESALVVDLEPQALMAVIPPGEFSSDFQWLSLKAWNPEAAVAQLDGAMIVDFRDYQEPSERFFGFAGGSDPLRIARALLDHDAREESAVSRLGLVPESTAEHLSDDLLVVESPAHFDYLYDVIDAHRLPGKQHHVTRNELSRFNRRHGDHSSVRVVGPSEAPWIDLLEVTEKWAANSVEPTSAEAEVQAVKRCADIFSAGFDSDRVLVSVLLMHGDPVGFDISEVVSDGRAIDHFRHTPRDVLGSHAFLRTHVARELASRNVRSWNAEQDLGIVGLRTRKLKDRPAQLLKKYEVRARRSSSERTG